eukprot:7219441-Pyramimonas_sp.AAC.1
MPGRDFGDHLGLRSRQQPSPSEFTHTHTHTHFLTSRPRTRRRGVEQSSAGSGKRASTPG